MNLPLAIPLSRDRRIATVDLSAWQLWWRFNSDPYVALGATFARRAPRTGPGASRRAELRSEFAQHARPALMAMLAEGGPTVTLRSTLLTLGRVGDEDDLVDVDLERYARHFLELGHADLRAGAILALGIRGDVTALPLLISLLQDGEEARELLRGGVSEHDRALAAYALGLIAREANAPLRRAITSPLLQALETAPFEVRLASVLALAHAQLDVCSTDALSAELDGDHLCGGDQLEALTTLVADQDEVSWLRAHAAVSLGRLAVSVADPSACWTIAGHLLYVIDARGEAHGLVRHGAVLGIGSLAARDDRVGEELRDRLRWYLETGDEMTKRFALVSLGRAAGRAALEKREDREIQRVLLGELYRGRKSRKGWAALALGVFAFERRESGGTVSSEVAMAMRQSLAKTRNVQDASAFVLGMALVDDGDPRGQKALLKHYQRTHDPEFRRHTGLVLGLLNVRQAASLLAEGLAEDPLLATPLGLLGHHDVVPDLVRRLEDPDDEGDKTALVLALARSTDPAAVAPLARLLVDDKTPHGLRTAAADGLGILGDGDALPWSAVYANGLQYQLLTETMLSTNGTGVGLLDGR